MKIAIISSIKQGPSGGGNQFLKALMRYFISENIYSKSVKEADVILVNSHHWIKNILLVLFALMVKKKKIVHRVDGPLNLVRGGSSSHIDKLIARFNKIVCTATIFQSSWSMRNCYSHGFDTSKKFAVIINGVDESIFYKKKGAQHSTKLKIVITSWSSNLNKGFELYRYIDNYLDFDKYDVTFIGNSPIDFRNIKKIPPLPSFDLAVELRKHDIYLTGSINDPCSNALIEAMCVGLFPVAVHSGGHPEILNGFGILFEGPEDFREAIGQAEKKLNSFNNTGCRTIQGTGKEYEDFLREVHANQNSVSRVRVLVFIPELLARITHYYLSAYIKSLFRF